MIKKTIVIFFTIFILCVTVLPAFATESTSANITCEEHFVNYPATPAYTHEVGIDIYHCANCSHEMWCCEECDQYMAIEEISCDNCEQYRAAIDSQEQAEINQIAKNKKEANAFMKGSIIFLLICAIVGIIYFRATQW